MGISRDNGVVSRTWHAGFQSLSITFCPALQASFVSTPVSVPYPIVREPTAGRLPWAPKHLVGTQECRIQGVIVSPTSNPSGERNRVTV